MKICFAIEKIDPATGGAERYCWDLAHFLADKGHEVAVICMKAPEIENPRIAIHKIKAVKFPQALRHLSFAIGHRIMAGKMTDWIHYGVGNTFFMDVYQPHGGLHAAWFERESLKYPARLRPAVRLIKRLSFKDAVQRGLEWVTLNKTSPVVLAISEMVRDDIRGFYGKNPLEIILIPNGIDTMKFSPEKICRRDEIRASYGLDEEDFAFLFVANNFILKGFRVLIEALEKLKEDKTRLLVVGEPDITSKKWAERLQEKVIFAGKSAELDYIYPACDCLAHPTYYDACSLVVLESLASGTPVITTSANGAAMFLKDGKSGCIIPPGDPDELEAAMKEIMKRKTRAVAGNVFKSSREVFSEIESVLNRYRKTGSCNDVG